MQRTRTRILVVVMSAAAVAAVAAAGGSTSAQSTGSPGAPFSVACVDVNRIVGGTSFSFRCITRKTGAMMITVATAADFSGTYPAGHDASSGAALTDLHRVTAISQVVETFMALKAAGRTSRATLSVEGIASKLAVGGHHPVASSATLTR